MPRLTWSAVGERFYETGIDRGVLYVDNEIGVAWTGLISVTENSSGGEAKPYYLDGIKYLNLSAAEEFEATLNAFSSPSEFAQCDGVASIHNGLFATQQPRKSFGFSYRTRVGNDLDGSDHGYKIHLVYNALSEPSDNAYSTIGESAEPSIFSWQISTLPPGLTGYKPTAHFVIDSRRTPKGLMAHIEDLLYGSIANSPRLLPPQELLDLVKSEGPIIRTNLFTNPSFRNLVSYSTEIRRNLVPNPKFSIDLSKWRSGGSTLTHLTEQEWAISGYAARMVHTTGNPFSYMEDVVPSTPGQNISASVRARSDNGAYARVSILYRNAANSVIYTAHGNLKLLPSTSIEVLTVENVITPSDAVGFQIWVYGRLSDGSVPSDNSGLSIDFSEVIAEVSPAIGTYFDGDTVDNNGLFYEWTGAENASASRAIGYKPYGIGNNDPVFFRSWAEEDSTNNKILNVIVSPTNTSPGAPFLYMLPRIPANSGENITFSFEAESYGDVNDRGITLILYPVTSDGTLLSADATSVTKALTEDWSKYEITITAPDQTVSLAPYLYPSSLTWRKIIDGVRLRKFLVEKSSKAEPFFDGDTPDLAGYFYSWDGTPNASESVLRSWH